MIRMSGVSDEAGKSLHKQISAHEKLGWRHIELRSIGGTPIDSLTCEQLTQTAKVVKEANLSVNCIGSRLGNWQRSVDFDLATEEQELIKIAEFCQLVNCRQVRIMSYMNNDYPKPIWREKAIERVIHLASLSEKLGLTLVHENCSGWGGRSIANMVALVRAVNSPALALLYDIGNGLAYGYDSLELLTDVLPWVQHVHIKDGIRNDNHVSYTLPGQGVAKVEKCLRYLVEHDYQGLFSIEPHIDLIPHLHIDGTNERDMQATYVEYGKVATALVNSILEAAPSDD